mmetsp:Transcript_13593/g.20587  ORF Transcript_13593/g.20587 Transcript_13593/m.20587 type:complete len:620 (+) Transcript_13593:110-1969(+)
MKKYENDKMEDILNEEEEGIRMEDEEEEEVNKSNIKILQVDGTDMETEDDDDDDDEDDEDDEDYEEEDEEETAVPINLANIMRHLMGGRGQTKRRERQSRNKLKKQQEEQRETFESSDLAASIKEISGYNFENNSKKHRRGIQKKRHSPKEKQLYNRAKNNEMLPNTMTSHITTIGSSIFCSQFSQNGDYFLIASQDAMIRLYKEESISMLHQINVDIALYKKEHNIQDTVEAPRRRRRGRQFHHGFNEDDLEKESLFELDDVKCYLRKSIKEDAHHEEEYPYRIKLGNHHEYNILPSQQFHAREIGYSCIDVDMNKDASAIIYSSWSPCVQYISTRADVAVGDDVDYREDIDYSAMEHVDHFPCRITQEDRHFCAFSIQFSDDSQKILVGGSDHRCYQYDLNAQTCAVSFVAHNNDVNTITYATTNSNVFLSGSDDKLIKIWDTRRLMGQHPTPVGVLPGHANGITKVSSKGDGLYFLSNGKDQSIKVWDIRMFKSNADDYVVHQQEPDFDYRFSTQSASAMTQFIDKDQSILTFRGHLVQRTLIRAYFSPMATTGQRFIYTGDASGGVLIYDILTGDVVKSLKGHADIVRDAAWHPFKPYLLSSSWDCSVCLWSPTK